MAPYYPPIVLLQTFLSLHGHMLTPGYFLEVYLDRGVVLAHLILQELEVAV
jgi:hypothetical protein